MKKIIISLVALVAAANMFAAKQTVALVIPQMECGNCQAKVEKTLAYEKGVKDLEFNLTNRVVTITYDDTETGVKELQKSLLKNLKYKSRVLHEGDALPTFVNDDQNDEEEEERHQNDY